MSKYVIAAICLLAFVAGGVAQLALHRTGGKSVKTENVAKTSVDAAPVAVEMAVEVPAETGSVTDAPPLEARALDAEAAVETADLGDSVEETGEEVVGKAGAVSRRANRRARRAAYRAAGPRVQPLPRPAPVVRQPTTTTAHRKNDGLHHKTARGVTKPGKWLGKGLKKIGGVFH